METKQAVCKVYTVYIHFSASNYFYDVFQKSTKKKKSSIPFLAMHRGFFFGFQTPTPTP